MNNVREKIDSFYDIKIEGIAAYIKKKDSEEYTRISGGDIILTFGDETCNKVNIEEYIRANKAIRITKKELIMLYSTMTDDEYEIYGTGMDIRTYIYTQELKVKSGYIDYFDVDEIQDSYTVIQDDFYGKGTLVKLNNGTFGVHSGQFYPPDDYVEWIVVFSEAPTAHKFELYEIYEEIRLGFISRQYVNEFECRSCGNEVHWLDYQGDLNEKLNNNIRRCCGRGDCKTSTTKIWHL